MASYNIYKKNQVYVCGNEHRTFEGFYSCHCKAMSNWAMVGFYGGTACLLAASACMVFSRFVIQYDDLAAAVIYCTSTLVALVTVVVLHFWIPRTTRLNQKDNEESAQNDMNMGLGGMPGSHSFHHSATQASQEAAELHLAMGGVAGHHLTSEEIAASMEFPGEDQEECGSSLPSTPEVTPHASPMVKRKSGFFRQRTHSEGDGGMHPSGKERPQNLSRKPSRQPSRGGSRHTSPVRNPSGASPAQRQGQMPRRQSLHPHDATLTFLRNVEKDDSSPEGDTPDIGGPANHHLAAPNGVKEVGPHFTITIPSDAEEASGSSENSSSGNAAAEGDCFQSADSEAVLSSDSEAEVAGETKARRKSGMAKMRPLGWALTAAAKFRRSARSRRSAAFAAKHGTSPPPVPRSASDPQQGRPARAAPTPEAIRISRSATTHATPERGRMPHRRPSSRGDHTSFSSRGSVRNHPQGKMGEEHKEEEREEERDTGNGESRV